MLIVKYIHNYLRAVASEDIDNGKSDLCLCYTHYSLPLYGVKTFPMLQKLLSHMSNWADRRDGYIPLTIAILRDI